MRKKVLLLAGGKGLRAGGDLPKQFQFIWGRPLLWWSLRSFWEYDHEIGITVVVNPEYQELWEVWSARIMKEDPIPHHICVGGKERGESVYNGLKSLDVKPDEKVLVAVHDGARPVIRPELIQRGFEMAEKEGNAVPVIKMTDSLRELSEPGNIEGSSKPVDRTSFVAVQTPQIFDYHRLREAYEKSEGVVFTDDASLVEKVFGDRIHLYEGDPLNIKVTNPYDFRIAKQFL